MIKLADTLEPMADFPSAYAKDIAFDDGDTLQEKLDTGSLGGGVGYKQLSQAEYDALTEDEKLDGREYRTYDTGHIYKLGVEYGKDGVQISDNETVEDKTWSSQKTSDEIAKVDASLGEIEKKIGNIDKLKLINLGENVDADNCRIANININCVYGYCGYFTQNVPMKGYAVIRCYHYGSGIRQFIDYTASTARTYTRFIQYNGQTPTAWKELATMDKVDGEVDKDKVAHIKRFYSVPENDWNNAIEEGYYSIQNDEDANAIGNKPHKYALQIRVIRADTNDVNYAYQIAYVSSEDTSIYIRRQKRDGTWIPWGKVCITTVADVGVTTITPVNSNITGKIEYTVKNGICYVSMKDLMSTISSTNLLISTTMPKPSINCTASSVNAGGNIATIYIDKNTTELKGNFYTKNAKSNCSFSYPVAE